MSEVGDPFRIGVTRDIRRPDGSAIHDLGSLDGVPGLEWEFLAGDGSEVTPVDAERYDALVVFSPSVTTATLAGAGRLVLVARLGVGYDRVDVDACTAHGVLLTITPDGVRRPMAAAAMAFVLALAHRVIPKDRQVREGRWERFADIGVGLTGRTLGLIGLGNIGRDLCTLAEPFGLRRLAYDPYLQEAPGGVELVSLDTLLGESDFVVVACPLTDETRHLLNGRRLALMKPAAHLVNVARGQIVDQRALTDALRNRQIAGAALDVFEHEPLGPDDPLLGFDNVILAPHAIGLTDEIFRDCGRSACRAVLDVAAGRLPRFVVNPEALDHPRLHGRLSRT